MYEKVKKAFSSDSLRKEIQQASPSTQTDCLEGFHSVLNQFAPENNCIFILRNVLQVRENHFNRLKSMIK